MEIIDFNYEMVALIFILPSVHGAYFVPILITFLTPSSVIKLYLFTYMYIYSLKNS